MKAAEALMENMHIRIYSKYQDLLVQKIYDYKNLFLFTRWSVFNLVNSSPAILFN